MTRSKGKRSNTRNIAARSFRKHGSEHISSYLQQFKVGEYVDIAINLFIYKGMFYKFYHGKTGKIFNVSKSSLGCVVKKKIGNRYIIKKINIKIEHVRKSRCKFEFFKRINSKDNNRSHFKFRNKQNIFFRKKPSHEIKNRLISFKKIKLIDPEPFCVIV